MKLNYISMKDFFLFVDEKFLWPRLQASTPEHKTKRKIIENYYCTFFCVRCHFYIILDANKFFVTDLSLGILLEISYLAILLEIAGNRRSTRLSAIL